MTASVLRQIQPALAYAAAHLDDDVSLAALSAQAGVSPFHLHRIFSAALKETPKRLTLRLRLGRSAVKLLTGDDSVLEIALSCGFQSHEVFCRAFHRRFGISPTAYRKRGFVTSVNPAQVKDHAELVHTVGPCIGLYHIKEHARSNMTYTITKKILSPQPVLIARRRIPRSEIAATIAEVLHKVFLHAQKNGIALSGLPFTRYVKVGPGLMTIEPGMRVAAPPPGQDAGLKSEGEVTMDELPGGPVAATVHEGPYEKLPDAYAAIEQWIDAHGAVATGTPWESYLTDPSEHPDPKDWKTEVLWPLES